MAGGRPAKALAKAKGVDETRRGYRPPVWAWRLVRSFLDPTIKPHVEARCAAAKVSKQTYYRALENEEFVTWFRYMLSENLTAEMSDVRQAHLKLCLTGNLEAIKLWYEHFGDFVPTQRLLTPDLSKSTDAQLGELERLLVALGEEGENPAVH